MQDVQTGETGSGSPAKEVNSRTGILLLHGLTGMPSEMRPIAKHLQKAGYTVSTPLLPGHGATHIELLKASWQDWLATAQDSYRELKASTDTTIICGLSMGAILAALVASQQPIDGIVMLSTTLYYDGSIANANPLHKVLQPEPVQKFLEVLCYMFPQLGHMWYWTESPPYGLKDERLQRQITKAQQAAKQGDNTEFGLFRTYFGSFKELNVLVRKLLADASRITCPTLMIHSLEDTLTSIDNSTDIYARLSSQDKSVVFLTGCDHVMTLDLQRKQVAEHIVNFAKRISASKISSHNHAN